MTAAKFREMALSLSGAIESEHMGHPDFRVGGKIFATLSAGEFFGVLMLTPEEQRDLVAAHPESFSPVPGGWGRQGSTRVDLENVKASVLRAALKQAWQRRVPAPKKTKSRERHD